MPKFVKPKLETYNTGSHTPKLSPSELKNRNTGHNSGIPDARSEGSAFNSLPDGYGTASRAERGNTYGQTKLSHNRTAHVDDQVKAQESAFNQLPSNYGESRTPKTDYRRAQRTEEAHNDFHNQRQQSADSAREDYFDKLDKKKGRRQERRREARQEKKQTKKDEAAAAEHERLAPQRQVDRYKSAIEQGRNDAKVRAGGTSQRTAGMSDDDALGLMKQDMSHRFKSNGGMGGVGRSAVRGAVGGGVIGGSLESMQGGDFWDGAKSGALIGATGMAGARSLKQATGAQSYLRGEHNILNTYRKQTDNYGVGVKALMTNNRMVNKSKEVMDARKNRKNS